MNEMQNENGTWSEAEPIKASWETNRLLMFFRNLTRKPYKQVQKSKEHDAVQVQIMKISK